MTDQDTAACGGAAGVEGSTRRELMRGGVAATAALALASTAPALVDPAGALAAPMGDGAVLVSLLRVEQVVVFAYERSLASGIPSASAQSVLTSFLGHERAHVRALTRSVTDLGGVMPAPPTVMAAFESELRRLRVMRSPADLHTERDYLRFLVDLETVIARHYRFAIEILQGAARLTTAAEIMANEAQHATLMRELLSPGNIRRAVPSAFVADTT
jgi:ferritin-like protein